MEKDPINRISIDGIRVSDGVMITSLLMTSLSHHCITV